MAFKFVLLFAAVSAASAGVISEPGLGAYYHQPAVIKQVQPALIKKVAYEHHEAPANYQFNYEVHDTHTGDIKRQHEVAKDGHISGEYSLIDADGFRRVVSYTADDHNGFQANVQREPVDHKLYAHAQPVVTKVVQPTVTKYIQPAVTKIVQPAAYAVGAPHHPAPVYEHQPQQQYHSGYYNH